MTEGIVHDLELVEIQVQEGMALFRLIVGNVERIDEPVFELAPVNQPGQRVMRCLVRELAE